MRAAGRHERSTRKPLNGALGATERELLGHEPGATNKN